MEADIKTIILIIGIFRLIMIMVFSYQYLAAKSVKGPGWWLAWSVAETVSSLVMLMRGVQGLLPVAIVLQNPVIVAGSILMYIGITAFFSRKILFRRIITFFGIYYFLHLFFYIVIDDADIRTILLYAALLTTTTLSIITLVRYRKRSVAMTANAVSVILSINGIIMIFRLAMLTAGVESPTMFSSSPLNFLIYFNALIAGLILAFGFIIMVNQKLNHDIMMTREKLEVMNAEKDKLFSIIAHDLSSPFNILLGMTDILADPATDLTSIDSRKNALMINATARQAYELLQNLLQWSKLERGLIPSSPALHNVALLSDEVISTVNGNAGTKRIELEVAIPGDLDVYSDPLAFQTILRNLLTNAIKFTCPGGKIMISARKSDSNITEIAVSDNGIGMNSEILDNLFRIDSKVNRKGTQGEPSSGLGLIICRELLQRNSGTISVSSTEGSGSVFTVRLPAMASG